MANRIKGEVDLVAGKDRYVLALSINEIVALEDLLDVGILEIAAWFSDAAAVRAGRMRAVLWAALQRHHAGTTLEQAGDIMAIAGLGAVVDKLGDAISAAFPESNPENPQRAAPAGTGGTSS